MYKLIVAVIILITSSLQHHVTHQKHPIEIIHLKQIELLYMLRGKLVERSTIVKRMQVP